MLERRSKGAGGWRFLHKKIAGAKRTLLRRWSCWPDFHKGLSRCAAVANWRWLPAAASGFYQNALRAWGRQFANCRKNKKHPASNEAKCSLELLARFELATSSLPTALEYKNRCIPAFMVCFSWRKVRIPSFFTPALSIPIYTSWVKTWVRVLWAFLQTKRKVASHC